MPGAVPDVLAAVDLGSNSFHMIVARYQHGQLTVVDRLREMVRLAAGLDDHGRLSGESVQRALQCLERFGQRLRDMRAGSMRVVGTNTLRLARRKGAFLERARDALAIRSRSSPASKRRGSSHANALPLIVLLRLAVLLHRGRGPRQLPDITLKARGRNLECAFPRGWLEAHPLTAVDLEQEAGYLLGVGFKLRVAT